jgi:hypothetical protein
MRPWAVVDSDLLSIEVPNPIGTARRESHAVQVLWDVRWISMPSVAPPDKYNEFWW